MADNDVRATIVLTADKASAEATKRLLADVAQDVKDLGKGDQLKKLDQSFDKFDVTITDTGKRFQKLTKDIQAATVAAQDLSKVDVDVAPSGGDAPQSGGIGTRITKFGQQLRNLPSQQIPGLGIGTDAVGNLARLGGVLVGVGEKASLVTTITTALTPALGATAAGIGGIVIAAAPMVIALAALGLALKSLADQAAKESENINAIVDAQREVGQEIARGLNTEEARKQLEELNRLRQDEAARIATLQQNYNANIESQGALTGIVKLTSGAEQALADQISKGTKLVEGYDTKIAALTKAMEDGSVAANDAAGAELERQQERAKADQEAKQAAEKAKQEAESQAKERERIQERILDSDKKFSQKQADDARQAAQKLEDIERGLRDKRADLAQKYNDDLVKIALDARRSEADALRKQEQAESDAILANRQAETDAALKHQRDLEDIQQQSIKDTQSALRERNFLEAALIGEGQQQQIDEANKAAQREAQDRLVQQQRDADERALNYQREAQERYIALNRARQDRMTAYQIEQRDAETNRQRQLRDAQINQQRQEEQTLLGYQREQEQLQEHMNKLLGIAAEGQAAERAIKAGQDVALRTSNSTTNTSNNTNINDYRAMTFNGSLGGMSTIEQFKRIALQVQSATRYR